MPVNPKAKRIITDAEREAAKLFRAAPTSMITSAMSSSDKLKLPEIRFLTPEEQQQLTDLAEDIAQKMLDPDWKERQER